MNIYLKWVLLTLLDWLMLLTIPVVAPVVALAYVLLPVSVPDVVIGLYVAAVLAVPVIAAFTREGSYLEPSYSWGWIWGTYDNPPQGDEGFVRARAWFPGITTGIKGYLNRINWMIRNPLYGFAKIAGVEYSPSLVTTYTGDPDISDKDMRPGYYFAKVHDGTKLVAFEFYCVLPWKYQFLKNKKDLRMRLGWKVMTDKFERNKFAQLVNTINPFDGYGENKPD